MRLQTGWTGGQYSLCRGVLGAALLVHFAGLLPSQRGGAWLLAALGIVASACLSLGWRDRPAAALALVLLGTLHTAAALGSATRVPLDARSLAWPFMLLAHLFVPAAPYGSWSARGRVDPAGDWRMPAWLPWAHRAALLALLVRLAQRGAGGMDLTAAVLLAALAFDPDWIPPAGARKQGKRRARSAASAKPETLYYDGTCGLCHRTVRFLLAEDRLARFRFAPLQGRTFRSAFTAAERSGLPDSLVLVTAAGNVLARARAVRHALAGLGGYWRGLAALLAAIPAPVSDAAYDAVARIRHRIFRRPADACPLTPPRLRGRILSD